MITLRNRQRKRGIDKKRLLWQSFVWNVINFIRTGNYPSEEKLQKFPTDFDEVIFKLYQKSIREPLVKDDWIQK